MPEATRYGDECTGHDACGSRALITGSPNVFINSRLAGREGDLYDAHDCASHGSHNDYIEKGSKTVFINAIPAGRIYDPVAIGGAVAEGSSNVWIGG